MTFVPGTPVRLVHGKPWKRTITMNGTALEMRDDLLVVGRTFAPRGTYDSIGAPKLPGDHGTVEVAEGAWVLRRAYHRADDSLIGELFNIQTPARFGLGEVSYTDLEIDVVRFPDGRVQVVDEQDLESAVRGGHIPPAIAQQARTLAYRLADVLREGGDWRSVERNPQVPSA